MSSSYLKGIAAKRNFGLNTDSVFAVVVSSLWLDEIGAQRRRYIGSRFKGAAQILRG
jgi:hypothetical protein